MKYRTEQARADWNRFAKYRLVMNAKEWREELRTAHAACGRREIEMCGYESKSGTPELIQF